MKKTFLIILAAISLAACKTADSLGLAGQSFSLTQLNNKPLVADEGIKPAISFTDKQVNATVGCNRIFAGYTHDNKGKLSFTNGGATRMMCPDKYREDEFLAAFNKVAKYKLSGKTIKFYDNEGNLLFTATK